MNKTKKFSNIIMKMMESVTLDDDGNMQIIDEAGDAEAKELLSQLVLETARDWWSQMETAENSLADMSDEISFSEMNADPSHVNTADLPLEEPTVESLLMDENFNLDSILEMDDNFGPEDGDENFDDMMRGDDKAGIGDDAPMDDELDVDDGEMDALGGGGDDELPDDGDFDFSFLDDDENDVDLGDYDSVPGDEDNFSGDEEMPDDTFDDEEV